MTTEKHSPAKAGSRFAIAAAATFVVGVVAGWSLGAAVRRSLVVGGVVAAGSVALGQFLEQLPEIEAELDERAEEIEVEIEDAVAED